MQDPHTPDGRSSNRGSADRPFPDALTGQASENPGGWVYDVAGEPATGGQQTVQQIRGAWRIDDSGRPTGDYVPNRQFGATVHRTGKRRNARAWIAAVGIGTLILAGVAVLIFLLSDSGTSGSGAAARSADAASTTATTPATQSSTSAASAVSTTTSTARTRVPSHRHSTAAHAHSPRPVGRHRPPHARDVNLELTATGRVWVCLEDGDGKLPLNGAILNAGQAPVRLSSRLFRLYLGNTAVTLRVNRRIEPVSSAIVPVSYRIDSSGTHRLAYATPPCP